MRVNFLHLRENILTIIKFKNNENSSCSKQLNAMILKLRMENHRTDGRASLVLDFRKTFELRELLHLLNGRSTEK